MRLKHILPTLAVAGLVLASGPTSPAAGVPAAPHGPENVIVMIGDGMGYNQIGEASLYEHGVAYKQVAGVPGSVVEVTGTPSFAFESFPVQVDMSTYSYYGSYDPELAWTNFDYVKNEPTDSAAAGTAMATGVKTYNAGLGVDIDGNPVENISERAISMGKSAGSISSVPFSHATPASYVVHNESRNDYHGIANQEIASQMTVIMGTGHPWYTASGELQATPNYQYITEADFDALSDGVNDWTLVETRAEFEALTSGPTPDRVFGIAEVAHTLQQGRDGVSVEPYDVPLNDNVPSLATMTAGALNVLDDNENGFSLMVEGGAVDWAGHDNDAARNIEEVLAFNEAVDVVIDWVETNSSWKETLLIVTADHETGYLEGPAADPNWTLIEGAMGAAPEVSWHSGDHTNQLVGVFAIGAGAKELGRLATMTDPVRGAYLDNTDLANLLLDDLWADGPGASPGNGKGKGKDTAPGQQKDHPGKGKGKGR